MDSITSLIDQEKECLENEPFFQWLKRDDKDTFQIAMFARLMYFYVLGFRDLLELMREDSGDQFSGEVAAYVREDGTHFSWYLQDLKQLGGEDMKAIELWDRRLFPSRKALYTVISATVRCKMPIMKIVLISVFEATGEVFLKHTSDLCRRLNLESRLQYFGTTHYEDERAHSVDLDAILKMRELTDEEMVEARSFVIAAFDEYRRLFQCWFEMANDDDRDVQMFPVGLD